jgi:phosphoribosyl-ATP pyrophosphohydrolase/phosphoribosyl-AMP cyclohydrolase/histidinol dehydrogenase
VRQQPPGFCHRETHACFGRERNIQAVISRLNERILGQDKQSFTRTLANDAAMLQTKLLEEARELGEATSPDDIAWEAADVMYFALVKLVNAGVRLDDVYGELARRMNRIVRRPNKLEQEQA